MLTPAQPVLRDIVLVGGGHSHVGVLRYFAMNPLPGVRLTLICRDTHTPYSGMLPGYIAGHYSYDDVHIDLSRLAQYAGARFYRDEAVDIDRDKKLVHCAGRPPVTYDLLSINIGSAPKVEGIAGAHEFATPVKPIHGFNRRWLNILERVDQHSGPLNIGIVGAGAGGVELTLAIQHRLIKEFRARNRSLESLRFHLFDSAKSVLPTHNDKVRDIFHRILTDRGVQLHLGSAVERLGDGSLHTADGHNVELDEVLWVTRAGGPAWLEKTGLALDDDGCILTRDTLQTQDDDAIFAAGDIANVVDHPREKAGVFAVRQSRPLALNLARAARGKALKPFTPQKQWLALISSGDRFAIGSRGDVAFKGRWVWLWKHWIDTRFMARFSKFPAMSSASGSTDTSAASNADDARQAISAMAMRCGGCGAKVAGSSLSRALEKLQPLRRDDVIVGLHSPDDAAVLTVPPGKAVVHTVDFFRSFIDDPYVFGRVAANHSLGDIFAMGAEAQSATAVATIPQGLDSKVEDALFQMMSGAIEVLNAAGCSLVGGHTGEGQELALGFAINGLIDPADVTSKKGLAPGDLLILTKPLGTGTLFAAHQQLKAKGRWIDNALTFMQQSSQQAAQCLRQYGARACTDVTGFGLVGHLVEMTRPSGVNAALSLSQLPVLDGAEDTLAEGIVSSLQPANRQIESAIANSSDWQADPRYPLLFDPQTAGGLLAGIPEKQAERCLAELKVLGYTDACVIGKVTDIGEGAAPIMLSQSL
ncbi:selenide, water dikinase SelD [Marinobacter sp. 1Y8]